MLAPDSKLFRCSVITSQVPLTSAPQPLSSIHRAFSTSGGGGGEERRGTWVEQSEASREHRRASDDLPRFRPPLLLLRTKFVTLIFKKQAGLYPWVIERLVSSGGWIPSRIFAKGKHVATINQVTRCERCI